MIDAAGAHSVYLGYHPSFGAMPYPGVLCTSVNDAALHGLPSDYVLADGDVLSIDFAAQVQGWVADSALTFQIGTQDPDGHRSSSRPPSALSTPASRRPASAHGWATSRRPSAPSAARAGTGSTPTSAGTASAARCTRTRTCPTSAAPAPASSSRPGLVIAIEPWFMAGGDEYTIDPDGWTIRTGDGSLAAHAEHTIAITPDGPLILTARD